MKRIRIKKKHVLITSLSIISVCIIIRLTLPFILKYYVNKVLADMPGYTGSISDVQIRLYRGAYIINDLQLNKVNGNVPVPFITAETIDLSIEWRSLLEGAIKGKAVFNHANLNFVKGPTINTSQTGIETDWTAELRKLLPIQINHLEIKNSQISYLDFYSKPKVNLHLNDVHILATNLSNLENARDKLPSNLTMEGTSVGNGKLSITGKMNVLKKIPDALVKLKITDINLPALNTMFKAYGGFEFEEGKFSLFSEMSLDNSNMFGYIKPILSDMHVVDWEKDQGNYLHKIWVVLIGAGFDVLKNQKQNQFATDVPIKGNIENIKPDIGTAIVKVFSNAFIKAIEKKFDNTVSFGEDEKKKPLLGIFKKKEK